MLVSVASFLPIIVVGPISDLIGTTTVILIVALGVLISGVASVLLRDPNLGMAGATADPHAVDPFAAALGADLPTWHEDPRAPSSPVTPRAPHVPEAGELTDLERAVGPSEPADRA
jgi:hypothetical protein